jgi:SAM-dependent methyltransferase
MTGLQHNYDSNFMTYADRSSRHSARTISALLQEVLPIKSVLDVGCAKGTWLDAWRESGVAQILGVDGSYVSMAQLVIPRDCFVAADLAEPIMLQRTFDMVQSLEVAEHIPANAADQFVESLVRHSAGVVLFSAAPPGQGGEFHVNEQPYEYWRAKFRKHGFDPYDYVRPRIANDKSVSFWYRYNTLLYVRADVTATLPKSVSGSRIDDNQTITDVSPLSFRARKMLVRTLPDPVRQTLARFKAHMASAMDK